MKRDPSVLEAPTELVIIGGGILGVCAARMAAESGIRTLLLERRDFGGQTSAGTYTLLQGSLQHLRYLDLKRMRTSVRERRFMMQAAPHMVRPMRFLVPCVGHGGKGPEAMRAALAVNDLMSADRNLGLDPTRHLPNGRIVSRQAILSSFPFLDHRTYQRAAEFYDGQMLHPERLTILFARAAAEAGAALLNYAEVCDIRIHQGRVAGVDVRDQESGREIHVPCSALLILAGPWTERLRPLISGDHLHPAVSHSKGIQIYTRTPVLPHGFAFDPPRTAITEKRPRGRRLYFGCPFGGLSLWGTTDHVFEGDPEDFHVTREDVRNFLCDINDAIPALQLSMSDVVAVSGGLRPLNSETQSAARHALLMDHAETEGICGAVSARGVSYTNARAFAHRACTRLLPYLPNAPAQLSSMDTPLKDSIYSSVHALQTDAERQLPYAPEVNARLIRQYGASYARIQELDHDPGGRLSRSTRKALLPGELLFAVREEAAIHLDDVLLRRTSGANPCPPSSRLLAETAAFMAHALGWNDEQTQAEEARVRAAFPEWLE